MNTIMKSGAWHLYEDGSMSWNPESRDWYIPAGKIKTARDFAKIIDQLRRKTWWNSLHEGDLESVMSYSVKITHNRFNIYESFDYCDNTFKV